MKQNSCSAYACRLVRIAAWPLSRERPSSFAKRLPIFMLLAAPFSIGWIDTAVAAITGTTGAVVVASPPADITNGAWESNTQIRAFAELQQVMLSQAISADISTPGTSPSSSDSNLSPATLQPGLIVNSYALHFDVVGSLATQNAKEASGSITFSDDVLGLIALSDTLNSSNGVLGLPTVLYASGADHGLELNPAGGGTSDIITLSADRKTVTVDLRNASFPDDLRIVTAVPEPPGLILAAGVFGSFLMARGYAAHKRSACREEIT